MRFRAFSITMLIVSYALLGVTSCDRVSSEQATTIEARCEARWYNEQSNDSRCYGLQKHLTASVVGGDLGRIKESIDGGANVNGGFDQSIPVLEVGATTGNTPVVKALVEAGANINRVRPLGQTALKAAVINQHIEPIRFLLEKGADVCERTESTALKYAIEGGNAEIIAILKEAGAEKCP